MTENEKKTRVDLEEKAWNVTPPDYRVAMIRASRDLNDLEIARYKRDEKIPDDIGPRLVRGVIAYSGGIGVAIQKALVDFQDEELQSWIAVWGEGEERTLGACTSPCTCRIRSV